MVPDGVVPAPLKRFLIGIGVRKGEAATATARVVTATCRAVQWAGLTRARETAAQLDARCHGPPPARAVRRRGRCDGTVCGVRR